MKKFFLHFAVTLLAGAGWIATSCSSDDSDSDGTFRFPTAVEHAISPAEPYELTLKPDREWTVSIPTEGEDAAWFRIQDGEHQVYSIHGQAKESRTIRIVVVGADEFDNDRVCTVSLTVGDQTQPIATLTRYKLGRTIQIHMAQLTTNDPYDLYVTQEDGSYVYTSEPVTGIDLVTPQGDYNYQHRIRIEANMAWAINKFPAWLILSAQEGEAGATELFLRTDVEKCPFEDAIEQLRFVDSQAEGTPEIGSIAVKIPGCGDLWISTNLAAEERFNAAGAYFVASQGIYSSPEIGMTKNLQAACGSEVFLVIENDGQLAVGDASSWLHFAADPAWDDDAQTAGLHELHPQIFCAPNEGEARRAYLIVIPRNRVPEDFQRNSVIDGQQIAAAYTEYIASTLTQNASSAGEFVALYEDLGSESDSYFTLEQIPDGEWPLEHTWASKSAYRLTYKTEMAGEMAELKFNVPYTSYEIYGEEGPYAESALSPRWVDLADGYNGDDCKLIRIACEYDESSDSFTWTYEQPENPVAYFVFKNGEEIVGIIEFQFDGSRSEGVSVGGEYNPNIVLMELSEGYPNYDASLSSIPQYELTCTDAFQLQLNLPDYDDIEGPEWLNVMAGGYTMFDTEQTALGAAVFKKDGAPVFRIYFKVIVDEE